MSTCLVLDESGVEGPGGVRPLQGLRRSGEMAWHGMTDMVDMV